MVVWGEDESIKVEGALWLKNQTGDSWVEMYILNVKSRGSEIFFDFTCLKECLQGSNLICKINFWDFKVIKTLQNVYSESEISRQREFFWIL